MKNAGRRPLERLYLAGNGGIALGTRLFFFLLVILLTIFFGVIAILLLSGTLTAGLKENERFLESELQRLSADIAGQYGQISRQTVKLARELAASIEQRSTALELPLSELGRYPFLLEELIAGECELALYSLILAKSSGVFFILDGTINPTLSGAASSRAGLYLKNMEPNVLSASAPNITVLRGFPGTSRKRSLPLHAQWQLEFDTADAPFYHRPLETAAAEPRLPLSQLYYWSEALILPGTSEEAMLCTAPLIDSQGCVFGVCGLEMSGMLFKLSYLPNNSTYKRLFCLLAPVQEDRIELSRSLFAGGYSARIISGGLGTLKITGQRRRFHRYKAEQGEGSFLGIHAPVQLYPHDSAFADQNWTVALLLPEEDLMKSVVKLNLILFSSLVTLVIAGAVIAFVLSNRFFIKPLSEGLALIRDAAPPGEAKKTRIPEIDNLIDFLARRDRELAEKARQENLSIEILNRFLERAAALTRAEQQVFKLYGEGLSVHEIAEKLYLSINTIKTHSKHIYAKLEVTSREEIVLYSNLLKEIGREINFADDTRDSS